MGTIWNAIIRLPEQVEGVKKVMAEDGPVWGGTLKKVETGSLPAQVVKMVADVPVRCETLTEDETGSPGVVADDVYAESVKGNGVKNNRRSGNTGRFFLLFVGRFGWVKVEDQYLPYIIRVMNGFKVRYMSVRMAETALLAKYLNFVHVDVVSACARVDGYPITSVEAHLLNSINRQHSDAAYGDRSFVAGDDMVATVDDVLGFHEFLKVCRDGIKCDGTFVDKCGFVRIGADDVPPGLPYAVAGDEKYLPAFLFDGQTETISARAVELDKWPLAYLKFCLAVLGVRGDLYAGETSCPAIGLGELKRYFPPETVYQAYWPAKLIEISHLVNGDSPPIVRPAFWIKPAVTAAGDAAAAAVVPSGPSD